MKLFFGVCAAAVLLFGMAFPRPVVFGLEPTQTPVPLVCDKLTQCKFYSDCTKWCSGQTNCSYQCNGYVPNVICGTCAWTVGNFCDSWSDWSECIPQPPGMPCASAQTRSCLDPTRPSDLEVQCCGEGGVSVVPYCTNPEKAQHLPPTCVDKQGNPLNGLYAQYWNGTTEIGSEIICGPRSDFPFYVNGYWWSTCGWWNAQYTGWFNAPLTGDYEFMYSHTYGGNFQIDVNGDGALRACTTGKGDRLYPLDMDV